MATRTMMSFAQAAVSSRQQTCLPCDSVLRLVPNLSFSYHFLSSVTIAQLWLVLRFLRIRGFGPSRVMHTLMSTAVREYTLSDTSIHFAISDYI